jgi:hypothetical protein
MSDHKSPAFWIRASIFLKVKVLGPTFPLSTSSQVQGADTGAPGFARTPYTAAWVALQPSTQLEQHLGVEAGSDFSREDEFVAIEVADQQSAETEAAALRIGESADDDF